MARETTYQRLKRENSELKKDIYELICNPEKESGIMVKKMWQIRYDGENIIWQGDVLVMSKHAFGILNKP